MAADEHLGGQFVFHAEPQSFRGGFAGSRTYVHVGSRRAALARVHPDLWEEDLDNPMSMDIANGRSRVWQAQLRDDVRVGPHLTDDEANAMRVTAESRSRPSAPYDVYPYKNEYEDPGSTSYLVHPQALTRLRPIISGPEKLRRAIDAEGH